MKLRLIRHLWGVEEQWETFFPKIQKLGYTAIESCPHLFPEKDQERLKKQVEEQDFQFVVQIHSDSYEPRKRSKEVKVHLATMRTQLEIAVKLFGSRILYANSHSGYEGWTRDQKEEFFRGCMELEKGFGFVISHETHRKRIFYNPWDTRDFLEKFPDIKVTADLSHWFNVLSETTLDGERDIMELVASRTHYVHGRVGYENGPQVPEPRAPEWEPYVQEHEKWWDLMWKSQAERGYTLSNFCPEYGPPSYMHTQPYTRMPVTNLFDICEWQTVREVKRFQQQFGTV